MDDALHGRLYSSRMVLCALDNSQRRRDDNDILEFLIKTEMDDSVTTESTDEDGSGAEPPEGLPMGCGRMSESSYKSRPTDDVITRACEVGACDAMAIKVVVK